MTEHPFFNIEYHDSSGYAVVYLNHPERRNAMNWDFFRNLPAVVKDLEKRSSVRVCILAGRGKSFSSGLDVESFLWDFRDAIFSENGDGKREFFQTIRRMRKGFDAISRSPVIYIAAVHRHCIGGGLDLIAACDLRLCTDDASFSLRETKLGIVADLGSLQRLPGIIGDGELRLLAFTGKDIRAEEALRIHLVSESFKTQEEMMEEAEKLAKKIASNPNLAVTGTKEVLNFDINRKMAEQMDVAALYNTAFLDNEEFRAIIRKLLKKKPEDL
ncbi:MAG: enoyl-CoA hydratase-related protein [Spirochaetia bacterium]|nr:enoyl-CoA hydratase-related protein [Spirochaetia bacterium]